MCAYIYMCVCVSHETTHFTSSYQPRLGQPVAKGLRIWLSLNARWETHGMAKCVEFNRGKYRQTMIRYDRLILGSSGVKFEITPSLVLAPPPHTRPNLLPFPHWNAWTSFSTPKPSPANNLVCGCSDIFGIHCSDSTNPHLPGSDTKALPKPYLKQRRRLVDVVDDHHDHPN
jgi:hypothetical protein